MKNVKVIVGFMIILGMLMAPGCDCDGNKDGPRVVRSGKVKVKPHDDISRNNQYCKYEVTGAPSQGPAAIKVGEIICILCPSGFSVCDNFSEVEMFEGAVYPVKALTNGLACTDCPKGTDTPPGFPFQER